MTIAEILERSNKIDHFCTGVTLADDSSNVFGTMTMEKFHAADLRAEILYITTPEKLPKAVPGTDVFNFLVCTSDEKEMQDIPDIIRQRCNLLRTELTVADALNKMELIIFEERRAESAMRKMTEALFASGIRKTVDVGSEQIRCPLLMTDSNGTILEKSWVKTSKVFSEKFAGAWEQMEDATGLLQLIQDCAMDSEEMIHGVRIPNAKVVRIDEWNVLLMAVPMRVSGIEVGKLIGFTLISNVPAIELDLLYRLSLVLKDELRKQNRFQLTQKQRYQNFMWMLLEGRYPNEMAIEKAMEDLGLWFKGKCCIALFQLKTDQEGNEKEMLNILASQAAAKFPTTIWVIHQGELIFLFNMAKNEEMTPYELESLQKLAEVNPISIGLSLYSYDKLGCNMLLKQARDAAEFGYDILNQKFTKFHEVSQYSMFRSVQTEQDLMIYLEPKLVELFSSEKDGLRGYFDTLYYYLKYGGNTGKVAEKTHVHRNTVLYRVDKLQQKMNFEFGDGMTEMKLMLSFEILKYLNLFCPEE